MERKTQEFILDCITRVLQVVFAVLIIGPFVNGFKIELFILGILLYAMLFVFGLRITKMEEVN